MQETNVNNSIKGLNLDIHPMNLSSGQAYTHALNARQESNDGNQINLTNEPSNTLCKNNKQGYIVIGRLRITEQNRTILLSVNPISGASEIGQINNSECTPIFSETVIPHRDVYEVGDTNLLKTLKECCAYTTIINSACLNFNVNYPIHKLVYKITDCDTEIYWTDGLNPMRYLNIDNIPYLSYRSNPELCDPDIITTELDCEKINVFPNVDIPCITPERVDSGGSLVAGAYQFAIAYSGPTGEEYSQYFSVTNSISIWEQKYTNLLDFATSKSIRLLIDNLDQKYKYFNLAVIKTINEVSTPYLAGTYNIRSTSTEVTYTGNDKTEKRLDITDILDKPIYYDTAKVVESADNILMWGNLTSPAIVNYQSIASAIELMWETWKVPYNQFESYKNGVNSAKYRGYMRDEVYAFEFVPLLKGGRQMCGFPIVSRASIPSDLECISGNDVLCKIDPCDEDESCSNVVSSLTGDSDTNGQVIPGVCTLPRWKVYNTATIEGTYPNVDDPCYIGPYQYGKFAYWESEREYPCNDKLWGNLAGQKIRHHKFPDNSITHIHSNNTTGTKDFEYNIYPIGIKIDYANIAQAIANSDLTDEQKKEIVGFKILRADRTNNKSVIAKGLLYNVGTYNKEGQGYFYNNYPFNDLREDHFISSSLNQNISDNVQNPLNGFNNNDAKSRFTFMSPDTSFTKPVLGDMLKLETAQYGKSRGHFVPVKNHAEYRFLSTAAASSVLAISAALAALYAIPKVTTGIQWVAVGSVPGAFAPVALPVTSVTPNMPGEIISFGLNVYQLLSDLITKVLPHKNYAYQFNSVGTYGGYIPIPNLGSKIRGLDRGLYIGDGMQSVGDKFIVNNWKRESTAYLKLLDGSTFEFPQVYGAPQDTSRFTLQDVNKCDSPNDITERNISSFYASNKRRINDQYGEINSYRVLDTGFCGKIDYTREYTTDITDTIFGGDTFINLFADKKKLSFFIDNAVDRPNDGDITYSQLDNVGYPMYYMNSAPDSEASGGFFDAIGGLFKSLLGVASNRFDCRQNNFFYQKGKFYLFAYGIPQFFVESDYNVDYRQAENTLEKNFYPNVGSDIPDEWLQETNVPISWDNFHKYNSAYSKQNEENGFCHLASDYDPDKECKSEHRTRVISSQISNLEEKFNKWLVYKANDYKDFNLSNGELIDLNEIEQSKVMARFENTFEVYPTYIRIPTDSTNIIVGTGGIFSNPPTQYTKTDVGNGGSQHKAFNKTKYGHFFIDAKRGEVFMLKSGAGLEEISRKGMRNWFKENLPFHISRQFPDINIDNSFKDVGICTVWDNRFERYFITKKDYIPKNQNITYNKTTGKFYLAGTQVFLNNPVHFDNASWTIAYSPQTESWVSWYSFLPNYYIEQQNYFQSGTSTGLWNHLSTNQSFQTFYNTYYPFEIEPITKTDIQSKVLTSIQYKNDVFRYFNSYDFTQMKDVTFSEALIHTNNQTSGKLWLRNVNRNDTLSELFSDTQADHIGIGVDKINDLFKFNKFLDISLDNGLPLFNWDKSGVNKTLNTSAIDYNKNISVNRIRLASDWFKVRLINNKYAKYKFVFKLLLDKTVKRPL